MEFSIKQGSPEKQRCDCVVVGVYENGKLSAQAQLLDKLAAHQLSDLVASGDMNGKAGTTLMLHHVTNIAAKRVLLVGLGKASEFASKQFVDVLRSTMGALQKTACKDAALYFADLPVKGRDEAWKIMQTVLIAAESGYRSDQLKSKPADAPKLRKILLGCNGKPDGKAQTALSQATAIAHGMKLTKDLGNLPGNICTPTYLADQAKSLAKQHKLKATILEEKDMQKLGMHSLLSVTRGSRQPAKLITLEYAGGGKKQKPVVLVGKGITFDSGGISLKPGAEMDEMKYDMCGAASVLGTMQAIAEMGLKLNVVAVIPSCENMPDGAASKPGDIVKSMSGQTIEILNTDAEGRLILCDALTYTARFAPDTVMDIATLTGACVIALGHVASAGCSATMTNLPGSCWMRAITHTTAPGICRCGKTISSNWTATLPTCRTSAGGRRAASPLHVSCRALPRTIAGRTWTSPEPRGNPARKRAPRDARYRCSPSI